jgi:hypothetical protein
MSKKQKEEFNEENKTVNEKQSDRVKELEEQVQVLTKLSEQSENQYLKEKLAKLEEKLGSAKSQEEQYHERKAKYWENVKKRKEKESKRKELLDKLDSED